RHPHGPRRGARHHPAPGDPRRGAGAALLRPHPAHGGRAAGFLDPPGGTPVRLADLLKFSFAALGQQKVRTLLTTLGVVIGSIVLALSLSVGVGVQEVVVNQFSKFDRLRRIDVWTNWQAPDGDVPEKAVRVKGSMSLAKKDRIRRALTLRWQQKSGH